MKIVSLIVSIVLLLIIIAVYSAACYYIGRKGKDIFIKNGIRLNTKLYWGIFWVISLSYIIGYIMRDIFTINFRLTFVFTFIGGIWLGFMYYFIILFPLADISRFALRKKNFKWKGLLRNIYRNGLFVFAAVLVIIIIATINAAHPGVTDYSVTINKKVPDMKTLDIALVSDVHMGIGIREKGIDKLINLLNSQKPDIVFFCGDMVDESTTTNLKEYAAKKFKDIKSKYGIYAIMGNHEYYSGIAGAAETIRIFKQGGVNFLNDKTANIANSFYVAGMNDIEIEDDTNKKVKPLKSILNGVDKSMPIIVLKHRPVGIEESQKEDVDLELCGHTHDGQNFPNNLVVKLLYKDAYGYLKKNNFNLIVTSGYGTWGPPIRLGTKAEIANIKVNFK